MRKIKLYLVGNDESEKTNSWLAMTNDIRQAQNLIENMEGATALKIIDVEADEK